MLSILLISTSSTSVKSPMNLVSYPPTKTIKFDSHQQHKNRTKSLSKFKNKDSKLHGTDLVKYMSHINNEKGCPFIRINFTNCDIDKMLRKKNSNKNCLSEKCNDFRC